ncbi:unnamed protein product [Mucor hiemalis]
MTKEDEVLYDCFCNVCAALFAGGRGQVTARTRRRHELDDPSAAQLRKDFVGVPGLVISSAPRRIIVSDSEDVIMEEAPPATPVFECDDYSLDITETDPDAEDFQETRRNLDINLEVPEEVLEGEDFEHSHASQEPLSDFSSYPTEPI